MPSERCLPGVTVPSKRGALHNRAPRGAPAPPTTIGCAARGGTGSATGSGSGPAPLRHNRYRSGQGRGGGSGGTGSPALGSGLTAGPPALGSGRTADPPALGGSAELGPAARPRLRPALSFRLPSEQAPPPAPAPAPPAARGERAGGGGAGESSALPAGWAAGHPRRSPSLPGAGGLYNPGGGSPVRERRGTAGPVASGGPGSEIGRAAAGGSRALGVSGQRLHTARNLFPVLPLKGSRYCALAGLLAQNNPNRVARPRR